MQSNWNKTRKIKKEEMIEAINNPDKIKKEEGKYYIQKDIGRDIK
ncbi:unnamed protein product [marine sediment metagenome]|uniref:Uncharacterized protein n=1 Tax=marine sediment metagenome TaxID=412755 RepID=X1PNM9_9ZZZZ